MKNNTWLSLGLILFAIIVVLGGTWLMAQNGAVVMLPGTISGMMPFYGWGGALMQIFILVLFGLGIAGVVLLILWFGRNVLGLDSPEPPWELPEEILRARFAKGEITRQEFEEMRHALHG